MKVNPPMPKDFSAEVRDFILSLLSKDPKKRLGSAGASAVKQHPFFKVSTVQGRIQDFRLGGAKFRWTKTKSAIAQCHILGTVLSIHL